MSDTQRSGIGYAAGLAAGLWIGANGAEAGSLSAWAAILAGCAVFGAVEIVCIVANEVFQAIRRAREATR